MSTPRQRRKNKAGYQWKSWQNIAVWLIVGSLCALVAVLLVDGRNRNHPTVVEPHVVCPETLGVVFDMQGIPTILRTSCGSDFVVSPVIAGTYDLNRIASLMIDDMRTGTATVKGNRIDIDMGSKRDPNAWNDALVRAINA